jgi:hypothetical protein
MHSTSFNISTERAIPKPRVDPVQITEDQPCPAYSPYNRKMETYVAQKTLVKLDHQSMTIEFIPQGKRGVEVNVAYWRDATTLLDLPNGNTRPYYGLGFLGAGGKKHAIYVSALLRPSKPHQGSNCLLIQAESLGKSYALVQPDQHYGPLSFRSHEVCPLLEHEASLLVLGTFYANLFFKEVRQYHQSKANKAFKPTSFQGDYQSEAGYSKSLIFGGSF